MADVLSLAGQKLETYDAKARSEDALKGLRELIAAVEAGKLMLDENWVLVYQKQSTGHPGMVSTEILPESGTIAQVINLLEQAKFDIMLRQREM